MDKKIKIIIISVSALALLLIGIVLYQRYEMAAVTELMEYEQEQLRDDYEALAIQFDGYQGMEIRNDSLQDLLSREQQRVQDLLEELRITKTTNAKRITELKRELATVRKVMADYVVQIDSLNRTNARLETENKQYRQQVQEVKQEATVLKQAHAQLTETVTRASMLEIATFECITLNKYDRKTRVPEHITKLQFNYMLGKNIAAKPGIKTTYLRITTPTGDILVTDSTNLFHFENADIHYSACHTIEYEGEQLSDVIYYSQSQPFARGIYNADFFIDEQLVASYPFEIQ